MKAKVEEGQIDKGRDGSDGSEWFRVQSGVKVKVQGVQSRVLRIKMNCFITKELNYGYGAMGLWYIYICWRTMRTEALTLNLNKYGC